MFSVNHLSIKTYNTFDVSLCSVLQILQAISGFQIEFPTYDQEVAGLTPLTPSPHPPPHPCPPAP